MQRFPMGWTESIALMAVAIAIIGLATVAYAKERAARGSESTRTLRVVRGVLALPLLWFALFIGIVVRARLRLGHWPFAPRPAAGGGVLGPIERSLPPDSMPLHLGAVVIGTFLVILLTVFGPPLIAVSSRWHPRRLGLPEWGFVLSMGLFWYVLRVDPGGYVEWLVDD